ncbi:MAG: CDP-alcohol phosphatidyltransferase family protein, partial [Candidatus Anammoxibacter sp.]
MQRKFSKKFSKEAAMKTDPKKDYPDVSSIFGNSAALLIVRLVYNTFITPIHITFIALIVGMYGAVLIYTGGWLNLVIGAILIQIKNILDAADGSLARARNTPSRIGRFLDSVVDFIVGLGTFLAIGLNLNREIDSAYLWPMIIIAFFSSMLQCSYYVYYNIQYVTIVRRRSTASRIEESFTDDDETVYSERYKQSLLVFLQFLFLLFYGWQDKLVKIVDQMSLRLLAKGSADKFNDKYLAEWYNKRNLLKLNSILGLGTQLFLFSVMAALNQLRVYLWLVIFLGNAYLFWLIIYRIRNFKE